MQLPNHTPIINNSSPSAPMKGRCAQGIPSHVPIHARTIGRPAHARVQLSHGPKSQVCPPPHVPIHAHLHKQPPHSQIHGVPPHANSHGHGMRSHGPPIHARNAHFVYKC